MKTWFTADTHFGHNNIIRYCNRPYSNIHEQDESLIHLWNEKIQKEDIVYHLGDVAFTCSMEYALSIMKRLNGTIHLIIGNHDTLALKMNNIRPNTFASINQMNEIVVEDQKIVLLHYPMTTWHWAYKGSWQLYGHVHGKIKNEGKSLDVGVDCWNYSPVNMDQLRDAMKNKNIHEIIKDKWDKNEI